MKRISILVGIVFLLSVLLVSSAMAASLDVLCRVDIGDPASEAGHDVIGWGIIEPGGNWVGDWGVDNARVVWNPVPDPEDSRCAYVTLDRHIQPGAARAIRFSHLEGLNYKGYEADGSFDLWVREAGTTAWVLVYQYVDTATGSQTWIEATVDITGAIADENANIEVRVCATAPAIWKYFYSDWGQVAFDSIELLGETPNGGGEGFTPGYWKNHTDAWVGYSTDDSFNAIFSEADLDPDLTLLQAVQKRGNRVNSLIRHAAAGLLNASHPGVDYDLTVSEVIALVNEAFATGNYRYAKDILEGFNEQGGDING